MQPRSSFWSLQHALDASLLARSWDFESTLDATLLAFFWSIPARSWPHTVNPTRSECYALILLLDFPPTLSWWYTPGFHSSVTCQHALDVTLLTPTRSWCCALSFPCEHSGKLLMLRSQSSLLCMLASWLAHGIRNPLDATRLAFSWGIPARSWPHTVNSDAL